MIMKFVMLLCIGLLFFIISNCAIRQLFGVNCTAPHRFNR